MIEFTYLAALLVSICGLAFLDRRYKLVFWHNKALAWRALILGVGLFLLWDITGVASGIFYPGDSPYDTGLMLMPGVPIEELFFLTLLMYQALILWEAAKRWRRA